MELPQDVALLLRRLTDGLAGRGQLVGVYLYGSLVTGDYSPAASDIDVVVMVSHEPGKGDLRELERLHASIAGGIPAASQLHCLYVPADAGPDAERLHHYWAGDRMTQWRLKLMTQEELARGGLALHGPWPPPGIGPVPVADLQAAVHAEICGYWRGIARHRALWLQDTWVDHALTVLPRAQALLTAGEMITKSQAISRFADFGVPPALADEIQRRRDGHPVTLSAWQRVLRGVTARRIMRRGVRRLSSLGPAAGRT